MEVRGHDELRKCLSTPGKGFVLLTAHVGSWQVAMTALEEIDRTVHLLMRPEDNLALREVLDVDGEGSMVKIISTAAYLGGVLECVKAIDAGDVVSIMGDRAYGAESVPARFLGDEIRLPFGVFSIAAAARCPVIVLLTARAGPGEYVVDFSHVLTPRQVPRAEKGKELQRCVSEFAAVLEGYVERYPYQWFVFHDMWHHG